MSKVILLSEVITSLSLDAKVEETLKKAIDVEVSNAVKAVEEAATKALGVALKAAKEESAAEIDSLKEQLAALAEKTAIATGEVIGQYTCKKGDKKTYRFKKGVLKFKFRSANDKEAVEYNSSEALNNPPLMEELIALEVGFLEEVIED